ncbi:MAG TPA: hypothetical protein VF456_06305 [Vicinamibacterales bacterium]
MTLPERVVLPLVFCLLVQPAAAQTLRQRGFVDGGAVLFPQQVPNDSTQLIGDLIAQEEVFFKPAPWIQFAAGFVGRANSHDQVENSWRLDILDRGTLRPALSARRLAATFTRGPLTVDIGKQFIRWGKADIVTPTDRFAPQDFVNVIDPEYLAVTAARASVQWRNESFDGVWVPFFTPSRTPLLNQRWTVVPAGAEGIALFDASGPLPKGSQAGVRWGHIADGYEFSLSYFDGFNNLPNISVTPGPSPFVAGIARTYPNLRSYGFDFAAPTGFLTVKAEAAYATSTTRDSDNYVLYVVQLERQTGEWMFVGGYAGEVVTDRRALFTFAPDRGLTRSIVGRASYTIDANRSAALEMAVRQNGNGAYVKAEYSQARGQHWRATASGSIIRGDEDDFLGQYRLNSHVTVSLRYSF